MATADTLRDMEAFGLSASDIDDNGHVTLYHGGKELPKRLRPDEIFFMTPHKEEAQDYANMRGGQVFTLKVNPDCLNFNQGSYEVEFEIGGYIRNGEIIPDKEPEQEHVAEDGDVTYKGYSIGDKLPKTQYEIQDIVIHRENSAQFYLKTDNGSIWYDADTVIKYELKDPENFSEENTP